MQTFSKIDTIKALLNKNNNNMTLEFLERNYKNRNICIMSLWLEFGSDPNFQKFSYEFLELYYTIHSKDINLVQLFLEYSVYPNFIDHCNDILLLAAIWANKDIELIRLLLQYGANPNVQNTIDMLGINENDKTALHFLINKDGNDDIEDIKKIKLLIDWGIDLNIQDYRGNTALMNAVDLNKNIDIIKLLLDKGSDPRIKNIQGNTALSTAIIGKGSLYDNSFTCWYLSSKEDAKLTRVFSPNELPIKSKEIINPEIIDLLQDYIEK